MKELAVQELTRKDESSMWDENRYAWLDNENFPNVEPKPKARAQKKNADAQDIILKRARPQASSAQERLPVTSATEVPFLLIGLEAICNIVGAGPRTVKQWVNEDDFPARRCSDGVYRADPYSVQRWFSKR